MESFFKMENCSEYIYFLFPIFPSFPPPIPLSYFQIEGKGWRKKGGGEGKTIRKNIFKTEKN